MILERQNWQRKDKRMEDRMIVVNIAVRETKWPAYKEAAHQARVTLREWVRQALDAKLEEKP